MGPAPKSNVPHSAQPRRSRRRRIVRWAIIIFLLAITAWLVGCWFAAGTLIHPYRQSIPKVAEIGGAAVEEVAFQTRDAVTIRGWLMTKSPERVVVLVAGLGGNRTSSTEMAALWLEHGWSVLTPDLRATGASTHDQVTFGWDERLDVEAAQGFLRSRGFVRIGGHGVSLGAAALCYSLDDATTWDFLVIESCYDTIENAFRNRMDPLGVPAFAAWPIKLFVEWRTGIDRSRLEPVRAIRPHTRPLLVMAGDAEYQLKFGEVAALHAACSSEKKILHVFKGHGHHSHIGRSPQEYRTVFDEFLRWL